LRKASASAGKRGVRNAFATALSLAAVSGIAAAVGVVVAREFGRGPETDGFFAAYAVFLVLSLIGTALRIVVLPALARADELEAETGAWAAALAVVAVPVLLLALVAREPLAHALGLDGAASDAAADALPWMAVAGIAQVYAGLAASALAARDDYVTAAVGYAIGAVAGLALILWRLDDGIVAVAWGVALNGAVSLAVPLVRVRLRLGNPGARLVALARGAALPLVLQALYLVCVRFAAGLGPGEVSDLSYAYLIASALVAVTASSLALVSSVPLTRADLDAVRHVVSASWLSLVVVAAAAGVFALAGGDLVRLVLGDAYGGDLGRLVVALAPWMAISVGASLAYPLVFVRGRPRGLLRLSLAALVVHPFVVWAGREAWGAVGIALALALTTALVLVALLASLGALRAFEGLAVAVLTVTALGAAAFGIGAWAGPLVGLAVYAALLLLLRPPGLRSAWRYVRALS
jgi:O-antigen/teichoic acid export membrane protein